jgi:WD40-like Beta Propeller Repeat
MMLLRFFSQAVLGASTSAFLLLISCPGTPSQTLIYSLNNQIWKQQEDGSGKMLVSQSGERPRWIPGTKTHFAYIERKPGTVEVKLWVAENTGANPVALTGFEVGSEYSWSADGKWIAVSHTKDGNYEIYKLSVDGTQRVRLTTNPYTDKYPRWRGLPQGDMIAFVSARPVGSNDRVFIMKSDGTGEKELLSPGTLSWYDSPAWSSPGTKIAFVAHQGTASNIWIADILTGKATQVTSAGVNINPEWYVDEYVFFVTVLGQGETLNRYDIKSGTTKPVGSYLNYAASAPLTANGLFVFGTRQSAVPGPIEIHRIQHYSPPMADVNLGPGREPDVW